jgi:hypothetical protein
MEINATVKLMLLGVESPEVSSSSESWLPNASLPRRYVEEGTSISIKTLHLTAIPLRFIAAGELSR